MLKPERHALILHQVNLHNKVLSTNLSELLKVSEDTVRRDLMELSRDGKVIKVHGGALSRSFHKNVKDKEVYAVDNKRAIAAKALHLIQDGMLIFTSGGTTILELARMLPENLQATFVTGSIPAALEYMYHPNIEVILLGGKASKNSKITVGGTAISAIRQINADLCLIGINAIDPYAGITDSDWEVVEVKRAMIQQAKKTVALSISEKVNSKDQLLICESTSIDVLITELDPNDERLAAYRSKGVQLL